MLENNKSENLIDLVYSEIKKDKKISFDNLYKKLFNDKKIFTKQELGQYLRILEQNGTIFSYNQEYHDLNSYETVSGFAQWNLNGFCWLSDKDESNDFGISFNPNDNLLSIFNKKEITYGDEVRGKKIVLDDREFLYVNGIKNTNDKKLICAFDKEKKKLYPLNSNKSLWIPLDSDIPFEHDDILVIQSSDIYKYLDKKSEFKILEKLGNKNDKGMEAKIISLLSDLKNSPTVTEIQPKFTNNLINKKFFTIDSIYTSDIDDAIAIEKSESGYKLYVAIANVSAYVKKNDELDLHAKSVTSSNYLPANTIHMLPRELSENLCSLNVGELRSAMICEVTLDDNFQVKNSTIYEGDIKSSARLTYDDVDLILEGQNPKESRLLKNNLIENYTHISQDTEILNSLELLKSFTEKNKKEDLRQYWIVDSPEYKLNENGKIEYFYYRDENTLSQKMVETSMLTANIAVAEILHKNYPDFAMFRNQNKPLDGDKPKPATYDKNNEGHWGLQTNFYTHFTSPIRRYCDLIVHRLLKDIIYKNERSYSEEELNLIATNINYEQYKAKQREFKGFDLLSAQYFEDLVKNNNLNNNLEVIDYSPTGLVCKNKQLIEFFIPIFKLENFVTKVLSNLNENENPTIEEKKLGLILLNDLWNISLSPGPNSWTDERKNVLYDFKKKELTSNNTPSIK